ncbi:amidase family protein, partial [Streptomyces sp. T-3]|nr:amidase family protein [Streptomyces sp. T-3]
GRLRIARYADLGEGAPAADAACLAAYEEASKLLGSLGHEVEDIRNPFALPGEDLGKLFFTTWAVQSLRHQLPPEDEELLRPVTRFWRERGRELSGERFYQALVGLQALTRRVVTALQPYDAVLTPTLGLPPQLPEFFEGAAGAGSGEAIDVLRRQTLFTPYTGGWNVTGQPAASLPLHWTDAGLPVGVTLVGRPAGEAQLLSL